MTTNTDNVPDTPENREARRRQAGRLIARWRKDELRLTQVQFAESIHVSRSVVASAETGREISSTFVHALRRVYDEYYSEQIDEIATQLNDVDFRQGAGKAPDTDDMFIRRATSSRRIEGRWFALWETTTDHEPILNTESVAVRAGRGGVTIMENDEVSPENPEGGYLWRAEGRIFDNQYYLATYIARDPSVRSKGCLYIVVHPSGKYLSGQWIGCSYDGDWSRGLVVCARSADPLPDLLKKHRKQLPRLPYDTTTLEGQQ